MTTRVRSVRVRVKFVKIGFGFGSVLSKMRVLVLFVRFGFGSMPISIVCMSVHLHISKTCPNMKFSVRVKRGRGSVLR